MFNKEHHRTFGLNDDEENLESTFKEAEISEMR
jgi:hypothetical protein